MVTHVKAHLILIKSAVASGGKQHPLSTERQQQQQVENHIHYFLGKPNSVPTERAVGACGKSNALFKPNLGGLFRGPFLTKAILILLISAFSCRKNDNNTTFTQNNIVRAVLEVFSLVLSLFKIKGYC